MKSQIHLHSEEEGHIGLASDAILIGGNTIIESTDYNKLENKPSIEGNELIGDKSLSELGITKDSLNITPESLGITADSLGITPESMGMNTADTYSIYSLFHS